MKGKIGAIGMAGLQAGSKIMDGLTDIGMNSLNEALWGDYYRDKEVEQSQRLLDQQTEPQSKLMKQSKDQQLAMWNETNYGAQTAHLQAAGLNPALMYGAGGGGGSTTAGSWWSRWKRWLWTNYRLLGGIMAQSRISLFDIQTYSGVTSFGITIPAGITQICVSVCNVAGISDPTVPMFVVDVTPNTTYTVTINATPYTYNNYNTFGALFTFPAGRYLNVSGVE